MPQSADYRTGEARNVNHPAVALFRSEAIQTDYFKNTNFTSAAIKRRQRRKPEKPIQP